MGFMMPKSNTQTAPKQPDPVRIPSEDDPDVMAARKRKTQQESDDRRGRSSTDLTSSSAQAYTRTTLG